MAAIQDLANQGHFVVVSWFNPDVGKSGHVALVVPGEMIWGTWCRKKWMELPVVMDTGRKCRAESQKLSISFGPDKHNQVEFYSYK